MYDVFIFLMALNSNAQTDSELMRALNYGANADIKILVKDQDGEPVKNAIIKAAFLCGEEGQSLLIQ